VSRSGAKRCKVSQMVAGGRYELYSHYALKIQAVAASIPRRDDGCNPLPICCHLSRSLLD
jgi:hypothetical protein